MIRIDTRLLGKFAIDSDGDFYEGNRIVQMFYRIEKSENDYSPSEGPYYFGLAIRVAKRIGDLWRIVDHNPPAKEEEVVIY